MRYPILSWLGLLGIGVLATLATPNRSFAAAPGCGQGQVERLLGAPLPPGPSTTYISPRQEVTPFYQWESNNGYCGEVSLMISGLANGQWMSQFNARLICGAYFGLETNRNGAALLQAGYPLTQTPNYNAQLLIENPDTGVSGPYDFAYAERCGANARLHTVTYPYTTGIQQSNLGMSGYRDYMRWIKAQMIAGNQVTVAILYNGGADAQYDHEVSVLKIGTNHSPDDDRYYGDDVLYFDDHGSYSLVYQNGKWAFAGNPSVPHGAGDDAVGCTPYIFSYSFDALAKTRAQANVKGAPAYSIVIPDNREIKTGSGNTGPAGGAEAQIKGPHNYAFAVSGPMDPQGATLPTSVRITRADSMQDGRWQPNPWDENSAPAAGNNYETPYIGGPIGTCNGGQCVSNAQPAAMLVNLKVTVSGLTPGDAYNLYEYDLPSLTSADTGTSAALPIPIKDFNANAKMASSITRFTAQHVKFQSAPILVNSTEIVVFRAVPASAP